MAKNLKLLGRLVAIESVDRPAVSKTIIVPQDGADDFLFGRVVLVGPGDPPPAAAVPNVKPVPLAVKPGDEVYYASKSRAQTLRLGGKDLIVIEDDFILGIWE